MTSKQINGDNGLIPAVMFYVCVVVGLSYDFVKNRFCVFDLQSGSDQS